MSTATERSLRSLRLEDELHQEGWSDFDIVTITGSVCATVLCEQPDPNTRHSWLVATLIGTMSAIEKAMSRQREALTGEPHGRDA